MYGKAKHLLEHSHKNYSDFSHKSFEKCSFFKRFLGEKGLTLGLKKKFVYLLSYRDALYVCVLIL